MLLSVTVEQYLHKLYNTRKTYTRLNTIERGRSHSSHYIYVIVLYILSDILLYVRQSTIHNICITVQVVHCSLHIDVQMMETMDITVVV